MTDGHLLERTRAVAQAAAETLSAARDRINDLNVYPVPDGDTGTNMSQTAAAIVDALSAQSPVPAPLLAKAVARAALFGGRGNSGIILSQMVRGLCETLGTAEALDAATVAAALRSATDFAYRGVQQPVEGTMLTVVRAMSDGAAAAADGAEEALVAALASGSDALARTPSMLAALREAGVVDAGGAGLLEYARGALSGLRGVPVEAIDLPAPTARTVEAAHAEYSAYRYCTSYLVEGPEIDADRLERELSRLGDSLLVVGDGEAWKVHVHTDDPGAAISLGTPLGAVSGVEVADMRAQAHDRTERLDARRVVPTDDDEPEHRVCDVVGVVAGEGNRRLFESLGARAIVLGGQTMNPSTAELFEAIEGCAADSVVILPNNSNVLLAAQEAARTATLPVEIVATRSIQAGLAALVAYQPSAAAAENAAGMREAITGLRSGEITTAVRDATANGVSVHKGDFLALCDGRVIASVDDAAAAFGAVVEQLLAGGGEVLTVLRGDGDESAGAIDTALEALARAHPEIEIEVHDGGQPHYPALLSVE